jgi:hypothetical protein
MDFRRYLIHSLALGCMSTCFVTAAALESSVSNAIKSAVGEFKNNRCNAAWLSLSQALKSYLSNNAAPTNDDLKTAGLADLGLVCIQQPALKLWYFPQVEEAHGLYLQWPQTSAAKSLKSHNKTPSAEAGMNATAHVQYLPLPNGVALKDARLLVLSRHYDNRHPVTPGIKKKTGKHHETVHHLAAPSATASKFLVLAGLQQEGKTLWLDCYELSGGSWQRNTAPLSKIPPFLLGSLSGNIVFAGNDLILTASPSDSSAATTTSSNGASKDKTPDFSVYKLSLRLVDNYYLLDGQGQADTAYGTITQFLHAEQKGTGNLAKAWLEDPSLANIPKYLKLFNQKSLSDFRLISLSAPSSIYRYRLITFGKDDLIFDVSHQKEQWVIRAIFVAPSDMGWQRIAQSLPPIM